MEIICCCVLMVEMMGILEVCHSFLVGGNHSGIQTANKILSSLYY